MAWSAEIVWQSATMSMSLIVSIAVCQRYEPCRKVVGFSGPAGPFGSSINLRTSSCSNAARRVENCFGFKATKKALKFSLNEWLKGSGGKDTFWTFYHVLPVGRLGFIVFAAEGASASGTGHKLKEQFCARRRPKEDAGGRRGLALPWRCPSACQGINNPDAASS